MDKSVARLESPEECERFIENVREKHPELAVEARRRAVELRAHAAGAKSQVEEEALQAVYAYEAVRSKADGKKFHAARTWQMIKRHGIIAAVERTVSRPDATAGYKALEEMGMKDFAFEAVVLRHPDQFSSEAYGRAGARIQDWNKAQ